MSLAEDFRTWITEPARTDDELYTAELLVESGWALWCRREGNAVPWSQEKWDADRAHAKARLLNPAYRASLAPEKLDALVQVWAELRHFTGGGYDERPLGEVDTLRFFPHLTSVTAGGNFSRIDALAELRGLASLSLESSALADLGPLRDLPELKDLRLTLSTPWPELSALGSLPALKTLRYRGNLLALRDVEVLPAVFEAELNADRTWKTPLRSLRDLPAMPLVRHLRVESVADLAGVERFAACNLQLEGPFRNLGPLAGNGVITWLRLEGQAFADLGPLARMAALRELRMERTLPLDLSPLAEAPALRQVWVPGCKLLTTELAAINAFLQPWSDDFLLPATQAAPPLRFIAKERDTDNRDAVKSRESEPCPRIAFYGDDRAHAAAECRWFGRELDRRLDRLLGRGWREKDRPAMRDYWSSHSTPGYSQVCLKRPEDARKLRSVAECLHDLLRRARFPWRLLIVVEPNEGLHDEDAELEDYDEMDPEHRAERERLEWLDHFERQRERDAFLERQHRFTLLREQGLPIDPNDFAPPPAAEASDTDDAEDDDEETEVEDEGADQWDNVYATLDAVALWVHLDEADQAAGYYGESPENWHRLPEPPQERPRPPF